MEVEVTNEAVLTYWGAVKSTVWISNERFTHIQEHHPDDYDFYQSFIPSAIQDPFLILEDVRNTRTAMFIGKTTQEGVNVIVRLARAEDEQDRSFVVTMYPIGNKRLRRLARTNPVIYGCLPDSAHKSNDKKL